jgi:hypothetical protein
MLTKRRVYSSRLWARPLGVLGFSWASTWERCQQLLIIGMGFEGRMWWADPGGSGCVGAKVRRCDNAKCHTLGVCDLTLPVRACQPFFLISCKNARGCRLPARASEPWTLPMLKTRVGSDVFCCNLQVCSVWRGSAVNLGAR